MIKPATIPVLAFLALAFLCPAHAEITIYYVRHAEGGHNAKARYVERKIPQSEWPSWVGNPDVFSPDGEAQVQALTTNLQPFRFDFIAVSPVWRARHTILPYLRATGRVAEIWPELGETVGFPARDNFPTDAPGDSVFDGGTRIRLTEEEQPFFRFRADGSGQRECKVSNFADALAAAKRVEDLLRARFGTNAVTVLLVGHGNSSLTLLRRLTRNPSFKGAHLDNTHLWIVREHADGAGFALLRYNEGAPAMSSTNAPSATGR
ncbi:MAG: histidine phosphatase family protein [Verrucomicrobiia bacterium]